jgi:hypothetical protein
VGRIRGRWARRRRALSRGGRRCSWARHQRIGWWWQGKGARKGKRGAGELAAREGMFTAVASCCASPVKARAREEAPKLPLRLAQNAAPRYLFRAREIMQPQLKENTARAVNNQLF